MAGARAGRDARMVIKGVSCAGARRLAVHLKRTDTNERAELREVRGTAADDLDGALREMEAVASGSRSKKPFYHASINTRADEQLTPEQELRAIDRLEEEMGLTDQPRIVMAHLKEGRAHIHVVWSRIDLEKMTAISDSHNYRRHEIVARELEREFGHERVQGAHIEREGEARPDRTPSHAEMQQAERSGLSPQEAKAWITTLWNATQTGQEFREAVESQGWVVARGDRRDFVLIDPAGETHSLARRVEGAKAKDVRERLSGLDPATLPTIAQAQDIQEHRVEQRARAATAQASPALKPEDSRPLPAPAAQPQAQPQPIRPSEVPEHQQEMARQAAAIAKEAERRQATARAAETAKAEERAREEALTKLRPAERADTKERHQAPEPTAERAAGPGARDAADALRVARKTEEAAARQEEWRTKTKDSERQPRRITPSDLGHAAFGVARQPIGVAAGATNGAMSLVDFVGNFLTGGSRPPPARDQVGKMAERRRADAALERIAESMERGEDLSPADVRNLLPSQLDNLRAKGDDSLRMMVADIEREREREKDGSRYRER